MPSCVVKNCKNNSKAHKKYHGVTFHLFPINNEIIIKWIVAIRKSRNDPEWLPSKTSVVCSDHFDNKDLYITTRGLRRVTRSGYPKERLSDPSEANSKDADDLESSSDEADQEAEQSISSGNEDTCYPQSDTPVAHTAERIQEDQTKAFIVKVFHYLEHEFEVLKKMDAKMILINLSKLQYRTAMATGVSETTVLEILREEARQNAAMRESGPQNDGKPEASAVNAGKSQRPAQKRRRVCKKQSLAESSSEATDGSIEEVGHSSVAQDITIEPEGEMLVVKAEPFEYYNDEPAINIEPVNATAVNKKQAQKDPISLDVKPESPDDDEMNDTNETLAVQPSSSKTRRRISRKSDVASTHYQDQIDPVSSDVKVEPPDGDMNVQRTQAQYTTGASSGHRRVIELDGQRTQAQYTTGASSSHRRVIELDGRSLLRVGEVKVKRESDEEGFS